MNVAVAATFLVLPVIAAVGIGGLAYVLGRKSTTAGNAGFVAVLCIGIIGRLVVMSGVWPQGTTARGGVASTGPGGSTNAQSKTAQGLGRMANQLDRQNDLMEEQRRRDAERAKQAEERARVAAEEQARVMEEQRRRMMTPLNPTPPATPSRGVPPAVSPGAPPAAPPASPVTSSPDRSDPPRPAPALPKDDPRVGEIGVALKADMDARIESVLGEVPAVLAKLQRPPIRDRKEIQKRIDAVTALQETMSDLSKRLRDFVGDAQKELESKGVSRAMGPAMTLASEYGAVQRSFACDRLSRLLDSAKEEAEVLKEHFGKWTISKDGKVTSKDFQIQSKAQSARFFLETELDQKDKTIAAIRGK